MSYKDIARRDAQHKLSFMETRKRTVEEVIGDYERAREDARRLVEFDRSDVRSDIEFIALGAAIMGLLRERGSIEDDLGYWRAQLQHIDGAIG